ncbi:MAG: hypothetical protein FWF72_06405 [Paludibacter sp.]|nr:hypothetical protein [Paludibacter sp.]
MGAQASKADEVSISVDNPADKGKKGDAYLTIMIDMQDPKNPKQLVRQLFHGELGRWLPRQEVTVQARGNKESFRLEDELFDFSKISADKLYSVIQEAYNKNNNEPEKFTYRYVQHVNISILGFDVYVKSKLNSNDQIINDNLRCDLDGNPRR